MIRLVLLTLLALPAFAEDFYTPNNLAALADAFPAMEQTTFTVDTTLGDDVTVRLWTEGRKNPNLTDKARMYAFNANLLREQSPNLSSHKQTALLTSQLAALHNRYSASNPLAPGLAALANDPCIGAYGFDFTSRFCEQAAVAAYLRNRYEFYPQWLKLKWPNQVVDPLYGFWVDDLIAN